MLVYQDLVQKAKEMQLPDETTEQVRKAIAYMHTGGKMGERQTDGCDVRRSPSRPKATEVDQQRLGMTAWCEVQKTKLSGFIRAKN